MSFWTWHGCNGRRTPVEVAALGTTMLNQGDMSSSQQNCSRLFFSHAVILFHKVISSCNISGVTPELMFASTFLFWLASLLFKLYRRSVWRHNGVLLCKSSEVVYDRVSFRRLLIRHCETETADVASSRARPGDSFHQKRVNCSLSLLRQKKMINSIAPSAFHLI